MAADWHAHAGRLANYLADNVLTDPEWLAVFSDAPRHEFGPSGLTVDHNGRVVDSSKWSRRQRLRHSYSDQVMVTRFERGPDGNETPQATSSVSQPVIVAAMLELLEVEPGTKVLEIGTGPGYNACLLSMRLQPELVYTLDVQEDVVAEARANLARVGVKPHVAVGDGAQGWPEHAPYDRIIATCALPRIPYAWLTQLAPAARVVAPMDIGALLAVLDRQDDGRLEGGFSTDGAYFMAMRSDTVSPDTHVYVGNANVQSMSVNVGVEVFSDLEFQLWLELWLEDVTIKPVISHATSYVIGTPQGRVEISFDSTQGIVTQYGTPLWDRISVALDSWLAHGRPGRERLGFTVTPNSQHIWLDEPDSELSWPL